MLNFESSLLATYHKKEGGEDKPSASLVDYRTHKTADGVFEAGDFDREESRDKVKEAVRAKYEALRGEVVAFIRSYDYSRFFLSVPRDEVVHYLSRISTEGPKKSRALAVLLLDKLSFEETHASSDKKNVDNAYLKAEFTRFKEGFLGESMNSNSINFELVQSEKELEEIRLQAVVGGWTDVERGVFDVLIENSLKDRSSQARSSTEGESESVGHSQERKVLEGGPSHFSTVDHTLDLSISSEQINISEQFFENWVDLSREETYKKINDSVEKTLSTRGSEGLKKWIIDSLNVGRAERGLGPITEELLEGIKYIYPSSGSASSVAGAEIKRPMIIFKDSKSFKDFYKVLEGKDGSAYAEGVIVGISTTNEEGEREGSAGLIFTSDTERGYYTGGHEARHSIDPQVFERHGYDMILSEAFALFYETIVQPWDEEISPFSEQAWNNFESRLLLYYEPISHSGERISKAKGSSFEKITEVQYENIISRLVSVLRKKTEDEGALETQRWIVQQARLDQIF